MNMKQSQHASVWMHAYIIIINEDGSEVWAIKLWKPEFTDSLADHVKRINAFTERNLVNDVGIVEMVCIEV